MTKTIVWMGGAAVAALLACSPANAQTFKADLKPSNEVPPAKSSGSGSANATYDSASKKLTWTVNYSGLSGNATAGHIHGPAPAGQNAGVVVPFQGNVTSPIQGSATLTDAQAADLMAGRLYVNIHTQANPGGEIRGQLAR